MERRFTVKLNNPIFTVKYPLGWWLVRDEKAKTTIISFKDQRIAERLCDILNDSYLGHINNYYKMADKDNILISIALERVRLEIGSISWEEFIPSSNKQIISKIKEWLLRATELRENQNGNV